MWQKIYVIVADIHSPFGDIPLYKSIIQFAKSIEATDFIIAGDGLDLFQISKFPKIYNGVSRRLDIQHELDEMKELLRYTRNNLKSNIYYIRGNHCDRLEKYLATHAAELSMLRCLDIRELLGFKELEISYSKWLIIKPPFNGLVYHGIFAGENASKRELLRHNCNLICGHTHKNSYYEHASFFGKISCTHIGSIADKALIDEHCKYSEFSYSTQSFAVLYMNRERFQVDVINCESVGFQYQGRFYKKVF